MKEIVATEIAKRVKNGEVIGVGTGSTVEIAIAKIGQRVKQENLRLQVVPTSYETAWQCQELGLSVLYSGYRGELAWGFDGADAVDTKRFWLIKGKGGALLQEKILAAKCKHFVVIVDESKVCDNIAKKCAIPVEIIPSAVSLVQTGLQKLGALKQNIRTASGKFGSIITEAGNLIIDVEFDEITPTLESQIKSIVGVVENGLFLNYASEILIAGKSEVKSLHFKS